MMNNKKYNEDRGFFDCFCEGGLWGLAITLVCAMYIFLASDTALIANNRQFLMMLPGIYIDCVKQTGPLLGYAALIVTIIKYIQLVLDRNKKEDVND